MKNPNKNSISWKGIILYIIAFFWFFGGIIGFYLYELTDFPPFRWVQIPTLGIAYFVFSLIFIVFLSWIIFCVLCSIPGLGKKINLRIFGVEDEFPPSLAIVTLLGTLYLIISYGLFIEEDPNLLSIGFWWIALPSGFVWTYMKIWKLTRKNK